MKEIERDRKIEREQKRKNICNDIEKKDRKKGRNRKR